MTRSPTSKPFTEYELADATMAVTSAAAHIARARQLVRRAVVLLATTARPPEQQALANTVVTLSSSISTLAWEVRTAAQQLHAECLARDIDLGIDNMLDAMRIPEDSHANPA